MLTCVHIKLDPGRVCLWKESINKYYFFHDLQWIHGCLGTVTCAKSMFETRVLMAEFIVIMDRIAAAISDVVVFIAVHIRRGRYETAAAATQ